MTKQEEIREGIARRIAIRDNKGFLNHSTHKYIITPEQYEFTDRLLNALHSQGVVIKVDNNQSTIEPPLTWAKIHKAGYVAAEELI